MTSFQRLLRGLTILNRYSGITDVECSHRDDDPLASSTTLVMSVVIPISASIKVDTKDALALIKMNWMFDGSAWVFQP